MVETVSQEAVDEAGARRTILWAEFAVVMACLFPLVFSHFVPSTENFETLYSWVYSVFHPIARIGLILFIVWVADGNFKSIGIAKPKMKQDLLAVLALSVIYILFFNPFRSIVPHSFPPAHFLVPPSVLVLAVLSRRLLYEIAFRGYGIGRLTELIGNSSVPIGIFAVASAVANWNGRVVHFVLAVLLYVAVGIACARTKRIWAGFIVLALLEAYGEYQIYHALRWLS